MTERKEAVRAWAVYEDGKTLADATFYRDQWRAKAAVVMAIYPDRMIVVPVEIRPAPTGEGQNE